ncbi:MAG: DNA polymerase III subunit beta [Prevotella sp.]|nr:DNA polymerase III subunit beta [Prevotella sp.]MCI5572005.1 DNA polymerase III subunit beta [Prevotella sp.]MCI6369534.1 DNA polymerase III subunit beta [Prevotella sp.]MCI6404656.1 DNA polymerase III subunit beta [Prevotella sp.]MCI6448451.1 DNA polymerase III subunit beta [Prevotella sp.]
MRFSLSSTALSSKLNILSKVISPKNSISILECFLFEIKDGKLTLTASDNTNMMNCTMDLIEYDSDGSFCVPNRIMLTSVKELAEQPIVFDVNLEDNSIKMNYMNGSYRIFGQSANEYPRMKGLEGEATSTVLPSEVLINNINRTLFATAQDELRMVMNGLYFDLKEDYMAIVASDGHKLVRNRIYGCKTETPASFILPKKPATLLRTVLAADGSDVTIRFNQSNAEVIYNDGMLSCRLIEGKYPNYNSVIPQDNPNRLTIDRKALISALRRVMPFASESTQLVKLRIANNSLEINSEDIEFATSARENVVCEYGGMPMSIGFKGSALYEICNNLTSDEIVIELADPGRAGIISPAQQPEGEDVLMLIMPMLLND